VAPLFSKSENPEAAYMVSLFEIAQCSRAWNASSLLKYLGMNTTTSTNLPEIRRDTEIDSFRIRLYFLSRSVLVLLAAMGAILLIASSIAARFVAPQDRETASDKSPVALGQLLRQTEPKPALSADLEEEIDQSLMSPRAKPVVLAYVANQSSAESGAKTSLIQQIGKSAQASLGKASADEKKTLAEIKEAKVRELSAYLAQWYALLQEQRGQVCNELPAFNEGVAACHELQKTTKREPSEWQAAPAGTTPPKPALVAHRQPSQ
jgi:hypothetical protein